MRKFSNKYWQQVKEDFQNGMPKPVIRYKYKMSKQSLYARIKREGWKVLTEDKQDRPVEIKKPEPEPEPTDFYNKNKPTVRALLLAKTESSKIAEIIGMSREAFENMYRKEIANTLLIANAMVVRSIYEEATNKDKPSAQAQKLWADLHGLTKSKVQDKEKKINPFTQLLPPKDIR